MPSGTAPYWMTRWRKDQPLVVKWTFNTWYMQNILKHTRWAFIVRPINNPVQVPRLSLTSEIPTMLRQRRLNCQLSTMTSFQNRAGGGKNKTPKHIRRFIVTLLILRRRLVWEAGDVSSFSAALSVSLRRSFLPRSSSGRLSSASPRPSLCPPRRSGPACLPLSPAGGARR